MSEHRYRRAALRADYLRAGAGLALTAAPLAAAPMGAVPAALLGGCALLFAGFGARTWVRQNSRIRIDERGIARDGPFGKLLPWDELGGLTLRYYATRRDRSGGWMQLTLNATGATMRIDSTIEGFRDIAAAALSAAEARGVAISAATAENARVLGVAPPRDGR